MLRLHAIGVLGLLALAACGDNQDGGVAWRVPCGGTGTWALRGDTTLAYTFEHDDADRLTLERAIWSDGTLGFTRTATWDDDDIVHEEFDAPRASYTYDAELEDGRRVRDVYLDRDDADFDAGYTTTYTWDDELLRGWTRVFNAAGQPDQVLTISREVGTWTAARCRSGGSCDRYVGEGSYERPTYVEVDLVGDNVIDQRVTRSYDAHQLLLRQSTVDRADPSVASIDSEYVREADGTALRWEYGAVAIDPPTTLVDHFTLAYAFSCE